MVFYLDIRSIPIDFTLISVLTMNRVDRIPFLLQRWKHRICLSIFLTEKEIHKVEGIIKNFSRTKQITFILYILKEFPNVPFKSIYYDSFGADHYNQSIFPINLLRDFAIESIDTSHYVITDIDAFPSQTLYSSLKEHYKLLKNEKVVILIKTFRMIPSEASRNKCLKKGDCLNMSTFRVWIKCRWEQVPYSKKELRAMYGSKIQSHDVLRHVVVGMSDDFRIS